MALDQELSLIRRFLVKKKMDTPPVPTFPMENMSIKDRGRLRSERAWNRTSQAAQGTPDLSRVVLAYYRENLRSLWRTGALKDGPPVEQLRKNSVMSGVQCRLDLVARLGVDMQGKAGPHEGITTFGALFTTWPPIYKSIISGRRGSDCIPVVFPTAGKTILGIVFRSFPKSDGNLARSFFQDGKNDP